MSDEKIILTPEQATGLLIKGPKVHNFVTASFMLIGCDYERDDAIEALKQADLIELGGERCKSMNHALAVWKGKRVSFFETDPAHVDAFERALETAQ